MKSGHILSIRLKSIKYEHCTLLFRHKKSCFSWCRVAPPTTSQGLNEWFSASCSFCLSCILNKSQSWVSDIHFSGCAAVSQSNMARNIICAQSACHTKCTRTCNLCLYVIFFNDTSGFLALNLILQMLKLGLQLPDSITMCTFSSKVNNTWSCCLHQTRPTITKHLFLWVLSPVQLFSNSLKGWLLCRENEKKVFASVLLTFNTCTAS